MGIVMFVIMLMYVNAPILSIVSGIRNAVVEADLFFKMLFGS